MAYTPQTFNTSLDSPTSGPKVADDVWLTLFGGEALKQFLTKTVMRERHRVKAIKNGKSYQFPAIGRGAAGYHQPGQGPILGQNIETKAKTVTVDDLLVTSRMISNYEEALTHWDVRGEHARLMGDELAQVYDQDLFGAATKTCVDGTANVISSFGAASENTIGTSFTITNVIDAVYDAASHFDSTNIPEDGRAFFVTPQVYWDMIKDGRVIDRDFGNGRANQQDGGKLKLAGFEIVPTNNLALNFGTDTLQAQRDGAAYTGYTVDGSPTVGLAMQKQAMGSVHLMDLSAEGEYKIEYQAYLMITKMAVGHDVLRPECLHLISAKA